MDNESQHEHLNALCIEILIKLLIIRHIFFNVALITKDNNVLKIHVRTFILLFINCIYNYESICSSLQRIE